MARHNLYAVELGATLIDGITSVGIPLGIETGADASSGEPYPRHRFFRSQRPRPTFDTLDINVALGVVGTMGVSISDLSGGVDLYAQQKQHGGIHASGSVHRKYSISQGMVVPTSLNCQHQQDASLSCEVVATYDAVNDPIAITDSAAVPGGLSACDLYTLGPVSIEGVALTELNSVQIDFGVTVTTEGKQSEIWDTIAFISEVKPRITLTGKSVEWFKSTNVPILGKDLTHASTSIQLYKRGPNNTLVTGKTLTVAGLAMIDNALQATGQASADATMILEAKYDGTNDPITISV